MASLPERVYQFLDTLKTRLNDASPRLLPPGGANGNKLKKNGALNYQVYWASDYSAEGVIHEYIATLDGEQTFTMSGRVEGNALVFIRGVAQSPSSVNLTLTSTNTEVTLSSNLDIRVSDHIMVYYIRLKEI